jgi:hypothetical protein
MVKQKSKKIDEEKSKVQSNVVQMLGSKRKEQENKFFYGRPLSSAMKVDDLPDEMLVQVLLALGHPFHLPRVALVCRYHATPPRLLCFFPAASGLTVTAIAACAGGGTG